MLPKSINARDTYEVRQAVLWPSKPLDAQGVDTDDKGTHYGVMDEDGKAIAIISVAYDVPFPLETALESEQSHRRPARIRKFATLPSSQGRGVGTALISHAISETRRAGFELIWLDARASSASWYRKRGWVDAGEAFQRGSDGLYVRMIYTGTDDV